MSLRSRAIVGIVLCALTLQIRTEAAEHDPRLPFDSRTRKIFSCAAIVGIIASIAIYNRASSISKPSDSSLTPPNINSQNLPSSQSGSLSEQLARQNIEPGDTNSSDRRAMLPGRHLGVAANQSWQKVVDGQSQTLRPSENEEMLLNQIRFWKRRRVNLDEMNKDERLDEILEATRDMILVSNHGPHRTGIQLPVNPEDIDESQPAHGQPSQGIFLELEEPYSLHKLVYQEVGSKLIDAMQPSDWNSTESPFHQEVVGAFEEYAEALASRGASGDKDSLESRILGLWQLESEGGYNLTLPGFMQIDALEELDSSGQPIVIMRAVHLKPEVVRQNARIPVDPFSLQMGLRELTFERADTHERLQVGYGDIQYNVVIELKTNRP